MKRVLLYLLLTLTASPAWASGVFGGDADLSVEVESASPDYPILMVAWFKPANVSQHGTLVAMTDENSGGSLDSLALEFRGDENGDKITATSTAAGASSRAVTPNSVSPVDQWNLAIALFEDASTRRVLLSTGRTFNPTWSNEETTTRNVGALRRISIGTIHDGSISNYFNGRIAEAAIYAGVPNELLDVAVRQLASGGRPNDQRMIIRDYMVVHQPLRDEVNGTLSTGPTMEASGVTFDAGAWSHHPVHCTWISEDSRPHMGPYGPSGVFHARWPFEAPTPGPLPKNRLVVIDADKISLASASSPNIVGRTAGNSPHVGDYASGRQDVYVLDGTHPFIVTVAEGDTIEEGVLCYAADDGCVSDEGSVLVGVAVSGGSGGETIAIVPR